VGRRVEDGQVGPRTGTEVPDVRPPQRRRAAGGRRHSASTGVIPISRTASAMQNGIDDVKLLPGLQSVARATVTPADNSRRASG